MHRERRQGGDEDAGHRAIRLEGERDGGQDDADRGEEIPAPREGDQHRGEDDQADLQGEAAYAHPAGGPLDGRAEQRGREHHPPEHDGHSARKPWRPSGRPYGREEGEPDHQRQRVDDEQGRRSPGGGHVHQAEPGSRGCTRDPDGSGRPQVFVVCFHRGSPAGAWERSGRTPEKVEVGGDIRERCPGRG